MFLGKIPYLIKKSHIRRFDSTFSSIANLEMLLHLNRIPATMYTCIKARIFIFNSNQIKAKNNPDWRWGVKIMARMFIIFFLYITLQYFVEDLEIGFVF